MSEVAREINVDYTEHSAMHMLAAPPQALGFAPISVRSSFFPVRGMSSARSTHVPTSDAPPSSGARARGLASGIVSVAVIAAVSVLLTPRWSDRGSA